MVYGCCVLLRRAVVSVMRGMSVEVMEAEICMVALFVGGVWR